MQAEFQTSKMRKAHATEGKPVKVVLKLDPSLADSTIDQLKEAGVTLHARLGQQVSATIPLQAMETVENMPGVVRIAAHSMQPSLKTNVSRKEIHSSDIDGTLGTIDGQAYTGKGVTICLLDIGFDFQHPAFYDDQGRCRIKAVYLPLAEDGAGVTIDGMTLPGTLYDSPEQIAQLVTDFKVHFHGSHTACIAAGTRSPQGYGGIAPDADLVLCATNKEMDESSLTLADILSNDGLFHSLAFASHYAKQLQQRMVVNISQGINNGMHNGTGVIPEALEDLCRQGVPVVVSVGNEGTQNVTLHKVFQSDDDVLRSMMTSEVSRMDGYTYSDAPLSMQLSLYHVERSEDDEIYGQKTYTTLWQSPVMDAEKDSLLYILSSEVDSLAQGFSGELSIGVLKEEGGTHLACYYNGSFKSNYGFEFTVRSRKGTELYLYDAPLKAYDREGFTASEPILTMSDWATAHDVISVGAYCANTTINSLRSQPHEDEENTLNDIWSGSSSGKAFNGVECPTLCAPGVNVVSASNHYYIEFEEEAMAGWGEVQKPREEMMWKGFHYTSTTGTSQAAPTVAGVIAQWLQADSTLTVAQIRDIMQQSCRSDEFTSAAPERFGFGKVDAKKGVELVLQNKADGITSVTNDNETIRRGIYMLDGRQVKGTPARGLYIVDGKKKFVR